MLAAAAARVPRGAFSRRLRMSMLRSLGAPVMDPAQHATRVSSLSRELVVARAAAKVIIGAWREAVADAVECTQPGTQLTSHRAHQLVDYAGAPHANNNRTRSGGAGEGGRNREEEMAPVA